MPLISLSLPLISSVVFVFLMLVLPPTCSPAMSLLSSLCFTSLFCHALSSLSLRFSVSQTWSAIFPLFSVFPTHFDTPHLAALCSTVMDQKALHKASLQPLLPKFLDISHSVGSTLQDVTFEGLFSPSNSHHWLFHPTHP